MEWDLAPLLEGRTCKDALADAERKTAAFSAWKGRLASLTPAQFAQAVKEYAALEDLLGRISAYARMRTDTRMDDQDALADLSRVRAALSDIGNRTRFFTHWWKDVPDDRATALLAVLTDDAYVFRQMRALKAHTLPEEQENILSLKDTTGRSALTTISDMIDARLAYVFDGETLTREEIAAKFSHPDREVRRRAYATFYAARQPERAVLMEVYRSIVLDWEHERALRNYPSAISIRNKHNDLPDAVVHAHLEACRKGNALWQRYFRLKATLLGGLTRYDLYAPLLESERTYAFAEAQALTLDALGALSPRLRGAAEEIFAGSSVDDAPRAQKRSGAYCWGATPGLPPYLLFNHTGKLRDVMTVAHETGHGVHHQLSRVRTPLSFGHALPIAETASVFTELLLSERLLERERDPREQAALIAHKLDDMYATIGRQAGFTRWEIEAHRMIVDGATADALSAAWMANLEEQFGDVVRVPDEFKEEWLAIPHFVHTPFYCYAYSFGNLLSLALYERYKEKGASFAHEYEAFLAAGETMDPVTLCRTAGVDIADPAFWERGFRVVERLVERLEALSKAF